MKLVFLYWKLCPVAIYGYHKFNFLVLEIIFPSQIFLYRKKCLPSSSTEISIFIREIRFWISEIIFEYWKIISDNEKHFWMSAFLGYQKSFWYQNLFSNVLWHLIMYLYRSHWILCIDLYSMNFRHWSVQHAPFCIKFVLDLATPGTRYEAIKYLYSYSTGKRARTTRTVSTTFPELARTITQQWLTSECLFTKWTLFSLHNIPYFHLPIPWNIFPTYCGCFTDPVVAVGGLAGCKRPRKR